MTPYPILLRIKLIRHHFQSKTQCYVHPGYEKLREIHFKISQRLHLENEEDYFEKDIRWKHSITVCLNKRELDAYRARPLELKEGELENESNEMFETILQSKL